MGREVLELREKVAVAAKTDMFKLQNRNHKLETVLDDREPTLEKAEGLRTSTTDAEKGRKA